MPEPVIIDFVGNPEDLLADAKKVQAEMDKLSATLKEAGVSQSAYNKAVQAHKAAAEQQAQSTQQAKFSYTELASAVSLVRQGLELAKQAYNATAGETLKYAEQVRQLSAISGESTENTSRFIQVLDDYKIGADDAMLATKALTKNGLAPNIDTLAQLSDQYLKLNSTEEQNAFVLKNLGKGGLQWVEVLNKGSAAIKAQGAAISDGLLLSEKQVEAARKLEIAQDNWNDSVMALKLSLGNELVPAMTDAVDEINNTGRAIEIMREQGMTGLEIFDAMALSNVEYTDALKQANEETIAQRDAMLENAEATDKNATSLAELEEAEKLAKEAAQEMDNVNKAFLSTLSSVKSAQEEFTNGMAEADAALAAGSMTTEEHSAKVNQLSADYQAASKAIVLSIVEMKLAADGWTDAELNAYLEIGKSQGAFTQQQVDMAKGAISSANQIVKSYTNMEDPMLHVGKRAEDSADMFNKLSHSNEITAEKAYEASAAIGAEKSQLSQLPPSGSSWTYDFFINVHGRIPSFVSAAEAGAEGAAGGTHHVGQGTNNQGGRDVFNGGGGGFANYGTINIFANSPDEFLALVGGEV